MYFAGFETNRDYTTTYKDHPTDPRVRVVVMLDDDAQPPDGDIFAGTCVIGGRRGDDYVSADKDLYATVSAARDHYGNDDEMIERYLRIFHDAVAVKTTDYGRRGEATLWTVVTRDDLRRVGLDPEDTDHAEDMAQGTLSEWRAFDDDEVYGVGVLVNLNRTDYDDEDDSADDVDGWEWVDGPVFGFYGDEIAGNEANLMLNLAAEKVADTVPMLF